MSNINIGEMDYIYDNVLYMADGNEVYDAIPDVESEQIDTYRKVLIDAGFYVKIDIQGLVCNMYYASPSYVESNYGEYNYSGWSQ